MAKRLKKAQPKRSKKTQAKIHSEAERLKAKGPWSHLTWREAHGVATNIVTGAGPGGKRRKKKKKRR